MKSAQIGRFEKSLGSFPQIWRTLIIRSSTEHTKSSSISQNQRTSFSRHHNNHSHRTRFPEQQLELVTMYVGQISNKHKLTETGSSQRQTERRSTSTSSRRVYSWPRRIMSCQSTQTSTPRTSTYAQSSTVSVATLTYDRSSRQLNH